MDYCGGCGARIKMVGIGWQAIDREFGEGVFYHATDDGPIKHFPAYGVNNYWYGLEKERDEYFADKADFVNLAKY
jgi:hypothetical protein